MRIIYTIWVDDGGISLTSKGKVNKHWNTWKAYFRFFELSPGIKIPKFRVRTTLSPKTRD